MSEEMTQVKVSKSEKIILLTQEIEKLTTDLKNQKYYADMYQNRNKELEKEVEQMHSLFDTIPNVIGKLADPSNYYGQKNDLAVRFCSFLNSIRN